MQLTVKGRHVGVSERLREHVRARLESAISKYFTVAIDAHVVFESGKRSFEANITIHVGSGITLQAQGEADEIFACFDIAAGRVEKRLRRYKRRLRDHHRGRSGQAEAISAQQYVIEAEAEVHGQSPQDVHLHEAGGTDAIIDVVGACVGLELLSVERIVVSVSMDWAIDDANRGGRMHRIVLPSGGAGH